MLTAGVDLASQPAKTGAVIVDWSTERPSVVHAATKVTDERVLALCREVAEVESTFVVCEAVTT